jgi:hypothetical protein
MHPLGASFPKALSKRRPRARLMAVNEDALLQEATDRFEARLRAQFTQVLSS